MKRTFGNCVNSEKDKMIVKICGIKDEDNLEELSELKFEMIGLNFYPPSKRFLSYDRTDFIDGIPSHIRKVGVVVNENIDKVYSLVTDFELDDIQLHGSESISYCEEVAEFCNIIKAFGIEEGMDIDELVEGYEMCSYLLFDTKSKNHGGTGRKFDWNTLDSYTGLTPFLLSGGIGPADYEQILELEHSSLVGVDINSKFEIEPGIKNIDLIAEFLEEIK